ncbi:MAG: hypothetical protein KDA20_06840 [Phycisphaerales bacterium]|nr:hypothetical protein [Phycisphaerales bacterium]
MAKAGSSKKKAAAVYEDEPGRLGEALGRAWDGVSLGLGAAMSNATRLIIAATVLAIAIGWMTGLTPLKHAVAAQQADPIKVVFVWPASNAAAQGIAPAVRADLEQRVLGAVTVDPFDRGSLERARAALEASGWFRGSPIVRRRPGGVIQVRGAWRTPAAVVVHGSAEYLVDQDGAPLCLPIGGKPGAKLYRIEHPWSGPPEREGAIAYGEAWVGGDVQMAIELLKTIATKSSVASQIRAVDLSNCLGSGSNELRLVTQRGATLVWGAPPSAPAMGEVPTARKLEHLALVLSGTVRLDRPGAPINLHLPVIEIDQSASATTTASRR